MDVVDAWLLLELEKEKLLSLTDVMDLYHQYSISESVNMSEIYMELMSASLVDEDLQSLNMKLCNDKNFKGIMSNIHTIVNYNYSQKTLNNSKVLEIALEQDFDFSNNFILDVAILAILDLKDELTGHKMNDRYTMNQVLNMTVYEIEQLLKKSDRNVSLMVNYANKNGLHVKDFSRIMNTDTELVDFILMMKSKFCTNRKSLMASTYAYRNNFEWDADRQMVEVKTKSSAYGNFSFVK